MAGEVNKDVTDPISDALPDGQDPWEKSILLNLIRTRKATGKAKRQKLARDWFRSELFYNGIQWVTFDSKLRRWREVGLKKTTPKPVTNKYASYSDVFASLLSSIPVEVTFRPATSGDALDQSKTNIANELVEAIEQVTHMKKKQREAAPMVIRQGEVFLIPRLMQEGIQYGPAPEVEKASDVEPSMESLAIQAFKKLGITNGKTPPHEESIAASLDINGQPVTGKSGLEEESSAKIPVDESERENVAIPKIVIDVASTFECYMDEDADTLDDSMFFIRERSYDTSLLRELYPDYADQIKPTQKLAGDISRYFAGSLQRLTSGEFGSSGYFISSDQTNSRRSNLIEFWHDPVEHYPEGIYAIAINDNVLVHKGPLQYKDNGKFKKNIIHIQAKRRTKNIHGRSPLDDAIAKQVQRNRLESFIELIIYRMAAPHWLLPKGCGIEAISGEPGTSMQYDRVSASQTSVVKPEIVNGVPPNMVLIKWLEQIDHDTESVVGITPTLMGEIPPGTPAARLMEVMLQRSKERHADMFAEWNAGWCECLNMLVKIVREVKPVDLFRVTKRTFGGFAIKQFTEDDYDMNIDVIPETEQPTPPRSTAAEMSLVAEMTKEGIFKMPPPMLYEVCTRFNMDYLIKSLKSDKEYISRENYDLVHNNLVPIVKTFDNHPMHIEEHRIFRQSDEYADWAKINPNEAQGFEQHMMAHQDMEKQLAQANAPQAPTPPPAPPPQGQILGHIMAPQGAWH